MSSFVPFSTATAAAVALLGILVLIISGAAVTARYVATSPQPTPFGAKSTLAWDPKQGGALPKTAFPDLESEFLFHDDNILRMRLQPRRDIPLPKHLTPPYIVPDDIFNFNSSLDFTTRKKATSPRYAVETRNGTIVVSQANAVTGKREQIFELDELVFQQQVLRFSCEVSGGGFLSGWGELVDNYFRNADLFDMDPSVPEVEGNNISCTTWGGDWGTPADVPLYAQAPFFFVSVPTTNTHYGVFVANSHAGNLYMTKKSRRGPPIRTFTRRGPQNFAREEFYRTNVTFVGGVLDVFIITGGSLMEVVRRYHKLIGTANVPPAYALGYTQSRWGYLTLRHLESVIANFSEFDLPISMLSNDNDYNYESGDTSRNELMWTLNEKTYPEKEFRNFLLELYQDQISFIQIVDPFLALRSDYWLWESAKEWSATHDKVWFKNSPTDDSYVSGSGWAGWSTFVDFSSASTCEWWQQSLDKWRDKIPVTTSLLDMAEISAFGCGTADLPACRIQNDTTPFPWNFFGPNPPNTSLAEVCRDVGGCYVPNNTLNFPPVNPYTIGKDWAVQNAGYEIYSHTVTMDAWLGRDGRYYSAKSFYNLRQMRCTYDYYKRKSKKRPFLLVRATFPGAGQYAAHWNGDNVATWSVHDSWGSGLQDWVQLALWSNLHGVTTTGPDVGGFQGGDPRSSAELITRWHGVAAHSTWYWSHRSNFIAGQEPYSYPKPARDAIRRAMFKRWQLLPIFLSELMRSHFEGGPTLRHPSLEFPHDAATYVDSETQSNFMVGSHIFVASVVVKGADSVEAYLPSGASWYSLWSWRCISRFGGERVKMPAVLYKQDQPALLRGGLVHPMHTFVTRKLNDTRRTGISVVCALDAKSLSSSGTAYFDDGEDSLFDDLKGDLPAGRNNQSHPVRRVVYSCGVVTANTTTVFFSASVIDEGSPSPQPMPLRGRNATVTFLFPGVADVVDPRVLGIDGESFSTGEFSWSRSLTEWQPANISLASDKEAAAAAAKRESNIISIRLPTNALDGTTTFRLEYTDSASLPSYKPSGSGSSSSSSSSSKKETTGLIVGVAVLGSLLLVVGAALLFVLYRNSKRGGGGGAADASGAGGAAATESTTLLNQ